MRNEDWYKIRNIWYGMRYRCYNDKSPIYRWYGGKGIKICDRWLVFDEFYEDMKSTWFPGATIDRIDSDGDYTPENCRWLSKQENLNNANNGKSNERRSKTIKELRSDTNKSDAWRNSLKGVIKSEEHLQKISESLKGKKHTIEHINKTKHPIGYQFERKICPICGISIAVNVLPRHMRSKHE